MLLFLVQTLGKCWKWWQWIWVVLDNIYEVVLMCKMRMTDREKERKRKCIRMTWEEWSVVNMELNSSTHIMVRMQFVFIISTQLRERARRADRYSECRLHSRPEARLSASANIHSHNRYYPWLPDYIHWCLPHLTNDDAQDFDPLRPCHESSMLALILHRQQPIFIILLRFFFLICIHHSSLDSALDILALQKQWDRCGKKTKTRFSNKQFHVSFVISLRCSHILRLQSQLLMNMYLVNYLCFARHNNIAIFGLFALIKLKRHSLREKIEALSCSL